VTAILDPFSCELYVCPSPLFLWIQSPVLSSPRPVRPFCAKRTLFLVLSVFSGKTFANLNSATSLRIRTHRGEEIPSSCGLLSARPSKTRVCRLLFSFLFVVLQTATFSLPSPNAPMPQNSGQGGSPQKFFLVSAPKAISKKYFSFLSFISGPFFGVALLSDLPFFRLLFNKGFFSPQDPHSTAPNPSSFSIRSLTLLLVVIYLMTM